MSISMSLCVYAFESVCISVSEHIHYVCMCLYNKRLNMICHIAAGLCKYHNATKPPKINSESQRRISCMLKESLFSTYSHVSCKHALEHSTHCRDG